MTQNHRQEALSRAYVHSIAAEAGMGLTPRANDYGIDLSIHEIARRGKWFCETGTVLDVQVKSTTRSRTSATTIAYDLDAKAFDDLRDPNVCNPRILVLVIFPKDTEWLIQSEEALLLRGCAYWASLARYAAVIRTRSMRVQIPRANVFSAAGLKEMLGRLKTGGRL